MFQSELRVAKDEEEGVIGDSFFSFDNFEGFFFGEWENETSFWGGYIFDEGTDRKASD